MPARSCEICLSPLPSRVGPGRPPKYCDGCKAIAARRRGRAYDRATGRNSRASKALRPGRPRRGLGRPGTAIERFEIKVRRNPVSGCWEWLGSLDGHGYPLFGYRGRTVRAHRWSYEHHVGPIPDGLQLDHGCRRRDCVNPAHLEPVTAAENTRRARDGLAA